MGLLLLSACNSDASSPSRKLTSTELHGKRLFEANCAACHDAFSTSPRNGPGLKGVFKKEYLPSSGMPATDEHVRRTIVGGRKAMPPFDKVLDDDQIDDVIAYLHTL